MDKSLKWRFLLLVVVVVVSILYLIPSFVKVPSWWEGTFPSEKISLGLDLQGGMHLILEVETEKALANSVDRMISDLSDLLFNERIPFDKIERVGSDKLTLELLNTSFQDKLNKLLQDRFPNLEKLRYDEKEGIAVYTLGLREADKEYLRQFAVDQGLETIRNRIDEFGVSEPTIQKQGTDRILIQLPGIKDPKRALALIGKTALLEFKIVNDEYDVKKALAGEMPPDSEVLYSKRENRETGETTNEPYLVKKTTALTGEHLQTARVNFDQFNAAYVTISFDTLGAKIFERITRENVKKRLAIGLQALDRFLEMKQAELDFLLEKASEQGQLPGIIMQVSPHGPFRTGPQEIS